MKIISRLIFICIFVLLSLNIGLRKTILSLPERALLFSRGYVHLIIEGTCYYPEIRQTDNNPFETADGSKINKKNPINHRWVAISRDLKSILHFGDTIIIQGTNMYDGRWVVRDIMNKRFNNRIDFLVNNDSPVDKWDNIKMWYKK